MMSSAGKLSDESKESHTLKENKGTPLKRKRTKIDQSNCEKSEKGREQNVVLLHTTQESAIQAEETENHLQLKKQKLDNAECEQHASENAKEPDTGSLSPKLVDNGRNTSNHAEQPDTQFSDKGRPDILCHFCDFIAKNEVALKIHENTHSVGSLSNPVKDFSSNLQETGGNCNLNSELVLKCSHCSQLFSTCLDLERHISEHHHKEQNIESKCPHCNYVADNISLLTLHIEQKHIQHQTLSCELCGFHCKDDAALQAHFLGKTHLRRKNVAARGGFVQLLTKTPVSKKIYAAKKKGLKVDIPDKYSKLSAGHAVSERGKSRENVSKTNGDVELSTEMSSFSDSETKTTLIDQEGLDKKHKIFQAPIDILHNSSSSKNTGNGQSTQNMLKVAQRQCKSAVEFVNLKRKDALLIKNKGKNRLRHMHANTKGRQKNLLMKCKIKKVAQAKEFQVVSAVTSEKTCDSTFKQLAPSLNSVTEAMHELRCDNNEGLALEISHNLEIKDECSVHDKNPSLEVPILDIDSTNHKCLNTCSYCGRVFQNRNGLEVHIKRRHTKEMEFHCHPCGYSCVTRGDFEKHCQSNRHLSSKSEFHCKLCSLVIVETSLNCHMKEKHQIFSCSVCRLDFLTEDELASHKKDMLHTDKMKQEATYLMSSKDFILKSSAGTGELDNTQSGHEIEVSVQDDYEIPTFSALDASSEYPQKHLLLNKTQFNCRKCFYKTRSSTVLMRHTKLCHSSDYHFLCKACNLYTMSREGIEKHMKGSRHIENAFRNNIGLLFDECIEKVGMSEVKKGAKFTACLVKSELDKVIVQEQPFSEHAENVAATNLVSQVEQITATCNVAESDLSVDPPKRGRPRGNISRKCSYCGLFASSVTNLTVHIKRKHSHQYSYLCKVCNYYTVTKGDMERHCATKKHKGRIESEGNGSQANEVVIHNGSGDLQTDSTTEDQAFVLNKSREDRSSVDEVEGSNTENEMHDITGFNEINSEGDPLLNQETLQKSKDKVETVVIESISMLEDNDVTLQRKLKGNTDNACVHCGFVAHSASSLTLHIKRKHTKEFEYYCMACDYYAVTQREMMRHAATEKHKIKSQSYLHSSRGGKDNEHLQSTVSVLDKHKDNINTVQKTICSGANNDLGSQVNAIQEVEDSAVCLITEQTMDTSTGICTSEELERGEKEKLINLEKSQEKCAKEVMADKQGSCCNRIDVRYETSDNSDFSIAEFQNDLKQKGSVTVVSMAEEEQKTNQLSREKTEHSAIQRNAEVLVEQEKSDCVGHISVNSQEKCSAVPQETSHNITMEQIDSLHKTYIVEKTGNPKNISAFEEAALVIQRGEAVVSSDVWTVEESISEDVNHEDFNVTETSSSTNPKSKLLQTVGRFDASIVKLNHSDITDVSDEEQLPSETNAVDLMTDLPQSGKKRKIEGTHFSESTRIRCDDCGFLADGLSGLNVHIAMKHPSEEKHFHCLLCGKSFYTENNLHQHLTSAGHMRNEQASVEELPEGGATFKCVKCTEPFDTEQNLFHHIKQQHEELLREVNKYIVEDTEQINREREENQGNVCKYCGKQCKSSNSMAFLAHIRTHTGSKPFKCKICNFATAQLGDARNHVKRHLGMREYKCHICGLAFVMKKHLNTHLLGKHGVGTPKERKFTCNLCERSFTEKWALNNHMKLHTGEKPFKCTWPTCHYSFLTASAMKDHYRTHTGEKSFLCDLCGFAGGTRHALTKHRRQHTGEKPFKCDVCSFASTTQSHLTRHKRVHTGEKPYKCPWCDYRSNCAENIRKHILHTGKHEGVKMYNCPKCDYGTNIPVDFRNHLKELHPDLENPDLAYLHAGIVFKSYECRLKGQGATFVETTAPFTATTTTTTTATKSCLAKEKMGKSSQNQPQSAEQVQQVIIIQGFEGDFAIDTSVEEAAAATLQTLAMSGQVAEVVHITEDGQVITTTQHGTHVGSMLTEHLSDGATQVVLVETPGEESSEAIAVGTVDNSSGTVVHQVMTQGVMARQKSRVHASDVPSALDALLCAVSELDEVENRAQQQGYAAKSVQEGSFSTGVQQQDVEDVVPDDQVKEEVKVFHQVGRSSEDSQQVKMVTQVIHPSTLSASHEQTQVAFKDVVQGVLQFAVCDLAAADELMNEGVTQVIVNEEGTVHMVAGEGRQIIMQEAEGHAVGVHSQHMDLVDSSGEISQIIVTEELVQAMAEQSSSTFSPGATHYIVTEIPQEEIHCETDEYTHGVEKTGATQEVLQIGTIIGSDASSAGITEQLTSMVLYTQEGSEHIQDNSNHEQTQET
ncbi:zinc finger protein 407 [Protopterus annectens]|uniref:zinc finger protein 407 n=1 Tax=Protopterus annectens TaxID=7888 RepID=UPI001CFAE058|nr:zinc finger protein 407 [Protopterus annectens]